jgi:hypothetical protein
MNKSSAKKSTSGAEVRGYAEGGEVDEDDEAGVGEVGSAKALLAQLEGQGPRSKKKAAPALKRMATGGRGGSSMPKVMDMSPESLASTRELVAMAQDKGTAKEQMQELARLYQLRAATFSQPTLAGQTFNKNTLATKRFAEGGEAKKREEDRAPEVTGINRVLDFIAQRLPAESFPTSARTLLETVQGKKEPITESSFSPKELDMMRQIITLKGGDKGNVQYSDYAKAAKQMARQGNLPTSVTPGLLSMTDPLGNVQTTLGRFRYARDPEGNMVVMDTYDFNPPVDGPTQEARTGDYGAFGPYGLIRDYAGQKIPTGSGRAIRINLGKPVERAKGSPEEGEMTDPEAALFEGREDVPAPAGRDKVLDQILGAGETALTLGTGAAASLAGMPYGLYKGLTSGKYLEGKAADIAGKEAAAFMERNTYRPRTESAQENLAALAKIADKMKWAPAPGGAAIASIPRTAVLAQGERLGMAAEKALEGPVTRTMERGGKAADLLSSFGTQPSRVVRSDNPQFIPTTMMESMIKRLSPPDQMGERPGERLQTLRDHFGPVLDTGEGLSPEEFTRLQRSRASLEQQAALDKWVNSTLKKYVTRDMATPSDPVRKLAEDGITIKAYEVDPTLAAKAQSRREKSNKPDRLGQSEAAQMYEDIGDASFRMNTAGYLTSAGTDSRIARENPFLSKLDPETPVSRMSTFMAGEAEDSFQHLVDVIGEDMAAGRLRPEALNKLSMADAVKRAHAYNQEMAKRMETARVDAMQSRPVYKQYDSGYKWIQLTEPGDFSAESDSMGHSVRGYEPPKGSPDWKPASGTSGFDSYGVGGWNAIKEGRAKIFSLRDEKGQPHATAEVQIEPGSLSDWIAYGDEDFQGTVSRLMQEYPSIRNNEILFRNKLTESPEFQKFSRDNQQEFVLQVKGKQNAAVAPKYQEFGQDFLRGKSWARVNDADKVGLVQTPEGLMTKGEIINLYESLPDNVKNTGFVQERLENLRSGANPDYDYYGGYEYARDAFGGSSPLFPQD